MDPIMVTHFKDLGKVAVAAGSNVVAAAAKASVSPEAQLVIERGNETLHNVLTVCQIVVAVVTAVYVSFKLYRLWVDKKALAKKD